MKKSTADIYKNVKYFDKGKFTNVSLQKVGNKWITKNAKAADGSATLYCIPAFVDMRAYLGEPGNHLAETLESFATAAHRGGFQAIMAHGNKHKWITTREDVNFIKTNGKVQLIPVPSVRKNADTEEMTALFDMHEAGIKFFAMAGETSSTSGFMQRTQQYLANFNATIITTPYDADFRKGAMVAETEATTALGFLGAPKIAEIAMVQRDLAIAAYNCAAIHFSGISCNESLELIANAKKEGVQVSCDVSIFSLCFSDEDLIDFNSNLKLHPFLRTKTDQKALLKALKNGEINAITSCHYPQVIEDKLCEFSYANFGAISFQTFVHLALKNVIPAIGWESFIAATSTKPAQLLGMEAPKMILIDTLAKWDFNDKTNTSLANNSPLFNNVLTGKVIEIL